MCTANLLKTLEIYGTPNSLISMTRITSFFKIFVTFLVVFLYNPFTDFVSFAKAEESFYSIHVSSYRNRRNAETEILNFKKHGLHAFYRYESVEGKGNWFRVYIGRFRNEQEGREKGAELLKKGIISYYKPRKFDQDIVADKQTIESEKLEKRYVKPADSEGKPPSVEVPKKAIKKTIDKLPSKPRAIEMAEREIILRQKEGIEIRPNQEYIPSASPFSLSLNVGAYTSSSASDFKITEQTPSGTKGFSFTGDTAQISLESSLRVYRDLHLYGHFEYALAENIDLIFLSLGPTLRFDISDWFFPYLKGGVVYGDFDLDGPPGEFEDDFGWETGFGVDLLKSQFKIGVGFVYRNIEFDYKAPGVPGVSANDSSIDVSGFSISGSITYFF